MGGGGGGGGINEGRRLFQIFQPKRGGGDYSRRGTINQGMAIN